MGDRDCDPLLDRMAKRQARYWNSQFGPSSASTEATATGKADNVNGDGNNKEGESDRSLVASHGQKTYEAQREKAADDIVQSQMLQDAKDDTGNYFDWMIDTQTLLKSQCLSFLQPEHRILVRARTIPVFHSIMSLSPTPCLFFRFLFTFSLLSPIPLYSLFITLHHTLDHRLWSLAHAHGPVRARLPQHRSLGHISRGNRVEQGPACSLPPMHPLGCFRRDTHG